MRAPLFAFALLAGTLAVPPAARAGDPWEELMGPGKGTEWADPESRFTLELPVGWQAAPRRGSASLVDVWKDHPDYHTTCRLTIEMRGLPPKVKLVHLGQRVMDEVKKAVRTIQMQGEDRITISGAQAIRRFFTYQSLQHAELTFEVEQIIFMIGERAYIMTVETPYGTRQPYQEDLDKMLKTFVGSAPGEEVAKPKKHTKLKAGEMVNVDGVPY
jgi:hypothetical protein